MNPELLDKMPPASLEAEKSVLGSVLVDQRCLETVAAIVQPDDFYHAQHAAVFGVMLALEAARKPVDVVTLLNELHRVRPDADLPWSGVLADCGSAVPHAAHAAYYARIVRDKSILRGLIRTGGDMIQAAHDLDANPQKLLDRTEQQLQAVNQRQEAKLLTADALAIEVSDWIDEIADHGKHLGLPTGLVEFDEKVGGLFGGELIILAARPGKGKSALAAQIADYAAATDRLTYVASLEMSGRELALRIICSLAEVSGRVIRTNKITPEQRGAIAEGIAQYSRRRVLLDSRGDMTVEDFSRTVRRLSRDGLELAVLDYLGLLRASDTTAKRQRYEQVQHQTRVLKTLARDTGVRVMVLCQLNRTVEEDTPPQLSALRESGSVEQDADVVLFIHRPEGGIKIPDTENKRQKVTADWPAELIVAKQRNGETGRFKLDWRPHITRFDCWGVVREPYAEFSEFQ